MKSLTVQFRKSDSGELYIRCSQDIGLKINDSGICLEDGCEKLFTGFFAIQDWIIERIRDGKHIWLNENHSGLICEITFIEDDFMNGIPIIERSITRTWDQETK